MIHRNDQWKRLVVVLVLLLSSFSCSQEDQVFFQTQAAHGEETALALGKTQAAYLLETVAASAKTKSISAQTEAAAAAQTAIAKGGDQIKTQIAELLDTSTPDPKKTLSSTVMVTPEDNVTSTITATLENPLISITFNPPYSACGTIFSHFDSPEPGSMEIIRKGFSVAKATCDAQTGKINIMVIVFGGSDGNIFKAPDQQADSQGEMKIRYTPSFDGNIKINAKFLINGKVASAAGSGTMIPDLTDILKTILIKNEIIGAFLDFAEGLIMATFTGVKNEAYIAVHDVTPTIEKRISIGGHGHGASFPLPPYSQTDEWENRQENVSVTVPVKKGQTIEIAAGISTIAKTYGWSISYYNPLSESECSVEEITLTPVQ